MAGLSERSPRSIAGVDSWGARHGGPDPYEGLNARRPRRCEQPARSPSADPGRQAFATGRSARPLGIGRRWTRQRSRTSAIRAHAEARAEPPNAAWWNVWLGCCAARFSWSRAGDITSTSRPASSTTGAGRRTRSPPPSSGHALLDVHASRAAGRALELARGSVTSSSRRSAGPRPSGTPSSATSPATGRRSTTRACSPAGSSRRYLDGRLAKSFARRRATGSDATIAHQRADGSWPCAERPGLGWVDGHHTGDVLDSIRRCLLVYADESGTRAYERGLDFDYAERLFRGRAPKFFVDRVYPIDGQCAAQAITTFTHASTRKPRGSTSPGGSTPSRPRGCGAGTGRSSFSAGAWSSTAAHCRWVQAPMLEALTRLLAAGAGRVPRNESLDRPRQLARPAPFRAARASPRA